MAFLLDTDVFSALTKQTSPGAAMRLAELPDGQVLVSVVTLAEVEFGIARRPVHERVLTRIAALKRVLSLLPLQLNVVPHYADVRARLEEAGTPIGPNDLWLAAQALAEDLTLVTGNEREFRRVPGLRIENWLR